MTPLVERNTPKGFLRWFLRLPVWLYRLHLGWLLGQRFLLLTHIGRISGQPRQTVLEVVKHDPATDTYFIASGWGAKSNWLQNIAKNPEVRFRTSHRDISATAERLPVTEAQNILYTYAQRYPKAFQTLAKTMTGETMRGKEADCLRLAQMVPIVALKNRSSM